jgi:hypothetical protein
MTKSKYIFQHIGTRITLISTLLILYSCNVEDEKLIKEKQMKSDVTIFLSGPLLMRGGTVFVVPREVSVDKWRRPSGLPNPALLDWRLDVNKPITSQDRRLSSSISAQISIVRFDFPTGGTYEFRFLPSLESGVAPETQGSRLLESGNTYDYHPNTGEELFVPVFQLFTILGPESDDGRSMELVSEVKLGFLEERYRCQRFDSTLSCSVGETIK